MVLKKSTPYWTNKAKNDLKEIAKYLKKEASKDIASKQSKNIKYYANLLGENPLLGFKEPLLESEPEGFRSLIHEYYKIVYYIENDSVYIARIFDCRQDPDKLKQAIR